MMSVVGYRGDQGVEDGEEGCGLLCGEMGDERGRGSEVDDDEVEEDRTSNESLSLRARFLMRQMRARVGRCVRR